MTDTNTPRDDLPDHLEFIQDIVDRLSRNSFFLKGWSVTLIAAVFILAARGMNPNLAMLAAGVPAVAFWFLDAYYLQQERIFRKLFNEVRLGRVIDAGRFSLDRTNLKTGKKGFFLALVTPVTSCFHMPLLIVVIIGLKFFPAGTSNGTTSLL